MLRSDISLMVLADNSKSTLDFAMVQTEVEELGHFDDILAMN